MASKKPYGDWNKVPAFQRAQKPNVLHLRSMEWQIGRLVAGIGRIIDQGQGAPVEE